MPRHFHRRFIMLNLLEGWNWFENSLQSILQGSGFPAFSKSQAMLLGYVSAGVTRPIEIAKKMRLSRQAIGHISNDLIEMGVLSIRDDPTDGRSKILSFSRRARKLRNTAADALYELEALLRERVGAGNFETMKLTIDVDWGSTAELRSKFVEEHAAVKNKRMARRA